LLWENSLYQLPYSTSGGRYFAEFTAEAGYQEEDTDGESIQGANNFFTAATAVDMHGQIQNPQGQPVPGASVTLLDRAGNVIAATICDAQGNYSFYDVPIKEYVIRTEAAGICPCTKNRYSLSPIPWMKIRLLLTCS